MRTVSKDTKFQFMPRFSLIQSAEKGEKGDSYYDMMKWNLDKIAEGLSK